MRGYVVAKGNCFYAVIYEGVDPITGRERRRWHAAGPDRGAAEAMARGLAAKSAEATKGTGLTLAAYLLQRWLPAKRVSLRPSTWDSYRRRIVQHVVPRLGTVPLRRLRPEHFESLYAELLANGKLNGVGLDPKSVLEVHIIIRKALADALRRGLVVRNVAAEAEAPKRRRPNKVMRSWTAPQLQAFLDEARSHRLFPAFWLSANTGMRRGELLGLRWGEIDFAARSLSVNRALISVAYELHETPGKTRSSRRAIDLDAATIAVLRTWRDQRETEMGRPITDADYVVAAPGGEPIHPDRFSQCFRDILDGVDIPRIRLHDLRHTHATLLLKAHTPIKVVSERLGHSSPAFTMATYQHVLPGMQADAAEIFGQLLSSTGFYPVEEPVEAT
jgi:integrase